MRRVPTAEARGATFPPGCTEWAPFARIRTHGAPHKTEVPRQQWVRSFGKFSAKTEVPTSRMATPAEVKRLKHLGAINAFTSEDRVVLVCVTEAGQKAWEKASAASRGGGAAAAEGILLAVARLETWAVVPLPDHLPASAAAAPEDGGGDDGGGDGDDSDADDAGSDDVSGDGVAAAADADGGGDAPHGSAPATGPYGLAPDKMSSGVLAVHLKCMEQQMTSPIDLGRTRAKALSDVTYRNVRGAISRVLGWAELELPPPWATIGGRGGIESRGLFVLTDGPALARFLVFLLNDRGVSINNLFATANATLKVSCGAACVSRAFCAS